MDFEQLRRRRSIVHEEQHALMAPIQGDGFSYLLRQDRFTVSRLTGFVGAGLPLLDARFTAPLSFVFRSRADTD